MKDIFLSHFTCSDIQKVGVVSPSLVTLPVQLNERNRVCFVCILRKWIDQAETVHNGTNSLITVEISLELKCTLNTEIEKYLF